MSSRLPERRSPDRRLQEA
ncbi:hypothetical protein LINPERHAP2_LOCUS9889 [Linum perenne]